MGWLSGDSRSGIEEFNFRVTQLPLYPSQERDREAVGILNEWQLPRFRI
jgi:hypothetical protein